jgi:hypothetical protein
LPMNIAHSNDVEDRYCSGTNELAMRFSISPGETV